MTQAAQPKGLIWLASYPKSGNTWTRSFLHNLLAIMRGEAEDAWDINQMNEFSTSSQNTKKYEELSGKAWRDMEPEEIAALRGRVQEMTLEAADGLIFNKTHNGLMADRGYPTINFAVTTGAVYIVRNPLDVAISYSHHIGKSLDETIEIMGTSGYETGGSEKQVYEVMGSWSEHVESWAGRPHRAIHVMRYEDMLADPAGSFGALARFLLLQPTPAQLHRAVESSSFEALRKQEDEKGFREKSEKAERFFRAGKAEQWKGTLSDRQIKQILRDHGAVMARFGYIPAGHEHFSGAKGANLIRRGNLPAGA